MLNVDSLLTTLFQVPVWFWFALASAVITAFIAVIEKKLLQHEHALSFSAGHALLALLLSLPMLFVIDFSKLSFELLVLLYISTFAASVAFWLTAKGMKHLDISIASSLTVVNLAFIPFLAFFLIGEKLSFQQGFGILLIFLGVGALEFIVNNGKFSLLPKGEKAHYFILIIFAGVFYAFTAVIDKIALFKIDVFTFLLVSHFFVALNSLAIMAVLDKQFKEDLRQLFSQDAKTIFVVSFLSVVQRVLLATAIAGAFVSVAVAVKRLSSFFATIIGGKIFHEENLLQKTFVSIIMIAGAFILATA